MALITTDEAKTFMGIDSGDTDAGTQIDQLIPMAEALFYSMLKVDSLETGTMDEVAIIRGYEIWFKNFPVTAINSIGGVSYTGDDFDDYVATKNKVNFHAPDFLDKQKGGRIKVNYSFGYSSANMPKDIKLAIFILVSGLYNTKENYGTVVCKIGQESLTFRDTTESEDFKRILKNYKKKFICVI